MPSPYACLTFVKRYGVRETCSRGAGLQVKGLEVWTGGDYLQDCRPRVWRCELGVTTYRTAGQGFGGVDLKDWVWLPAAGVQDTHRRTGHSQALEPQQWWVCLLAIVSSSGHSWPEGAGLDSTVCQPILLALLPRQTLQPRPSTPCPACCRQRSSRALWRAASMLCCCPRCTESFGPLAKSHHGPLALLPRQTRRPRSSTLRPACWRQRSSSVLARATSKRCCRAQLA